MTSGHFKEIHDDARRGDRICRVWRRCKDFLEPPGNFSRDPHQEAGQLRARSEFLKIKALA